MKTAEIRVRFAPSPTGYLHVGGARTALFNWLFARKHRGTFILRIEDTDVERSSEDMVEGILDGLRWLELYWDEGPYFQSQRLALYRQRAQALVQSGDAYYCFCSPEELAAKRQRAGEDPSRWQYDRSCRSLPQEVVRAKLQAGVPRAIRFKVPLDGSTVFEDRVYGRIEVHHQDIEDFVLLRSDGHPTYHLSVVVDDADMGISHIIRGADHLSNTPKQVLLYRAFGLDLPVFAHLPLILGPDRSRLSKRHGATSVTAYREMGFVPAALRNFLALLGWSPGDTKQEIFSTEELIERFSLEAISKSNAVFDFDKALWMNGQYLRAMSAEQLEPLVREELKKADLWRDELADEKRAWFLHLIDLLKVRARTLKYFVEAGRPYLSDDYPIEPKAMKNLRHPELRELLPELARRFERLHPFTLETTERALRELAAERGVKAGLLINAVRTALTGSAVTPGIFDVIVAIGRERTVQRLRRAVDWVDEAQTETS
ncbi:MAG: glutamate--tRNA ligase [Acidobacteria bacterium]|nr:MAG: glutamate--tRNA ligase [Acidobacteriota bacterium]